MAHESDFSTHRFILHYPINLYTDTESHYQTAGLYNRPDQLVFCHAHTPEGIFSKVQIWKQVRYTETFGNLKSKKAYWLCDKFLIG